MCTNTEKNTVHLRSNFLFILMKKKVRISQLMLLVVSEKNWYFCKSTKSLNILIKCYFNRSDFNYKEKKKLLLLMFNVVITWRLLRNKEAANITLFKQTWKIIQLNHSHFITNMPFNVRLLTGLYWQHCSPSPQSKQGGL